LLAQHKILKTYFWVEVALNIDPTVNLIVEFCMVSMTLQSLVHIICHNLHKLVFLSTTLSFFSSSFKALWNFWQCTLVVTALCINFERFLLCVNIGLWFCGKSCGFSSQRINCNCITRTRFNLHCFLSLAVNPDMCQIKYRLPAMAVSQVQLDRAKVSTKSAVLMNLESRVCSL